MSRIDSEAISIASTSKQPTRCCCYKSTLYGTPKKTCESCLGKGYFVACADCNGTGWDAIKQKVCERCLGRGTFAHAGPIKK